MEVNYFDIACVSHMVVDHLCDFTKTIICCHFLMSSKFLGGPMRSIIIDCYLYFVDYITKLNQALCQYFSK